MLKLRDEQLTMWDAILPDAVRTLPVELTIIDKLLDDERFFSHSPNYIRRGKRAAAQHLQLKNTFGSRYSNTNTTWVTNRL